MSFKDLLIGNPKLMSAALFGAGFAVATLLFRYRLRSRAGMLLQGASRSNSADNRGDFENEAMTVSEEYKMVLVVRMDLKMGKGKVAAQCAHAAVGAVEKSSYENMTALKRWQRHAQPKVVLKVNDEESLLNLVKVAKTKKLPPALLAMQEGHRSLQGQRLCLLSDRGQLV
uniref:peptidyl-tRNA hydrolase n=1 Tax=Arion vulgaris TaxID=1028688 RepID=A0A0B7B516_9EUPU